MKKLFSLVLVLAVVACAGSLLARGTTNNTLIFNAITGGSPNPLTATNAGELSASFSNASGVKSTAQVLTTMIQTKVTQGFDMSVALYTTPQDLPGAAGGFVTFTAFVTNWGNGSQMMGAMATNKDPGGGDPNPHFTPGWTNAYSIALDNVWQSPSNANNIMAFKSVPVGGVLRVDFRTRIPAGIPYGSTNQMFGIIFSYNNVPFPGDSWPGAGAIAPSTVDTNMSGSPQRDIQIAFLVARAPDLAVIQLSKTVSTNLIRPYETITYTIKYTNVGSDPTINLKIGDWLSGTYFQTPTTLEINHDNGGWVAAGADGTAGSLGNRVFVSFTPNAGVVAEGKGGRVRFTVRVK